MLCIIGFVLLCLKDYTKVEPHPWTEKKIQIIGGGNGQTHCHHSNRVMPEHWTFHEGFLMRLLKMGEESVPEYQQQQRAIQLPDDEVEDSREEEQNNMCEKEPNVQDGEIYKGAIQLPRMARRHSHSCIVL